MGQQVGELQLKVLIKRSGRPFFMDNGRKREGWKHNLGPTFLPEGFRQN